MKVRIVIEEVVVDAECGDTLQPAAALVEVVKACTEEAVRLHQERQKKTGGGR